MTDVSGSRRSKLPGFPGLKAENVSSTHAVAGASEPSSHATLGRTRAGAANSRRLRFADGRRGGQERKRFSSESISFIIESFQLKFYFLQTVTVAARRRV